MPQSLKVCLTFQCHLTGVIRKNDLARQILNEVN